MIFPNVNGSSVFAAWYECSPEAFQIISSPGQPLRRPGTNASFFGGTTMSAFHIQSGNIVHTGGNTNVADTGNAATAMSVLFFENVLPGQTHPIPHTPRVSNRVQDLPSLINLLQVNRNQSGIRWAIGGFTLFLNETIANEAALDARYDSVFPGMRVAGWIPWLGVGVRRARTFVAYSNARNVVCFGVMSDNINWNQTNGIRDNTVRPGQGSTYFDMYTVLRRPEFRCNIGISVDGGSSTRVQRPSGNNPIELRTTLNPRANVLCQLTATTM